MFSNIKTDILDKDTLDNDIDYIDRPSRGNIDRSVLKAIDPFQAMTQQVINETMKRMDEKRNSLLKNPNTSKETSNLKGPPVPGEDSLHKSMLLFNCVSEEDLEGTQSMLDTMSNNELLITNRDSINILLFTIEKNMEYIKLYSDSMLGIGTKYIDVDMDNGINKYLESPLFKILTILCKYDCLIEPLETHPSEFMAHKRINDFLFSKIKYLFFRYTEYTEFCLHSILHTLVSNGLYINLHSVNSTSLIFTLFKCRMYGILRYIAKIKGGNGFMIDAKIHAGYSLLTIIFDRWESDNSNIRKHLEERIEFLQEIGMDINMIDHRGETIMTQLCKNMTLFDKRTILYLIEEYDADINAPNDEGETPFFLLQKIYNLLVPENLLNNADKGLEKLGYTINSEGLQKILAERGDASIATNKGETLLISMITKGLWSYERIKVLFDMGAGKTINTRCKDINNETAATLLFADVCEPYTNIPNYHKLFNVFRYMKYYVNNITGDATSDYLNVIDLLDTDPKKAYDMLMSHIDTSNGENMKMTFRLIWNSFRDGRNASQGEFYDNYPHDSSDDESSYQDSYSNTDDSDSYDSQNEPDWWQVEHENMYGSNQNQTTTGANNMQSSDSEDSVRVSVHQPGNISARELYDVYGSDGEHHSRDPTTLESHHFNISRHYVTREEELKLRSEHYRRIREHLVKIDESIASVLELMIDNGLDIHCISGSTDNYPRRPLSGIAGAFADVFFFVFETINEEEESELKMSDYQDNEEHLEAYRREMRKRYLDKIPLLNNNKNHTKYCKTLDVVENYTIRTAMSRTLDFKEELMSVVWHPRNIDKFKYLDPEVFADSADSDEDSC